MSNPAPLISIAAPHMSVLGEKKGNAQFAANNADLSSVDRRRWPAYLTIAQKTKAQSKVQNSSDSALHPCWLSLDQFGSKETITDP